MEKITDDEIFDLFDNSQTREKGFNLLVKKFSATIYWQLRRILLNHENTNDVMQNVFLKIWQNLHKFKRKSKLHTWIYRISVNEAITFIKTSNEKYNVSIDDENENHVVQSLHDNNYFNASEIEIKLQKSILKLPFKQRIVFLLRYYQEMNYAEMSKVLKTNINTLKATYHIAAKKIEENLKEN